MIFVIIGVGVIAALIWVGRKPTRLRGGGRVAGALAAAVAAAAAVACGLRGQWIAAIALVALSAWLGHFARAGAAEASSVSPKTGAMSVAEACSILGVGPQASRGEIETAYRRLMQRAHPDHGGSTGLAAQLNAARDRLLK
jgi:DnaJ-domain-containing protein 1